MEEYWILKGRGLLLPGVSLIHGSPLQDAEFQEMAKIGVGLVWSPRSNFELYGATVDVAAAKRAGVRLALAPDWSPTGSDGMMEELKYAALWNATQSPAVFTDSELVHMATASAAQLGGVDSLLGTIEKGKRADLLVLKSAESNPYRALLRASPSGVEAVVIEGQAVYGDPTIVGQLTSRTTEVEKIKLCGVERAVAFSSRWRQTMEELQSALKTYGTRLAPVAGCD